MAPRIDDLVQRRSSSEIMARLAKSEPPLPPAARRTKSADDKSHSAAATATKTVAARSAPNPLVQHAARAMSPKADRARFSEVVRPNSGAANGGVD